MRTTLLALNASYSHTSLSGRCLVAACAVAGYRVELVEMTINERPEAVAQAVFARQPAILACSVYIWNVRQMEEVCIRLKLMIPELSIVWGGPEVSSDPEELVTRYPFVDHLCIGEGESVLPALLKTLLQGDTPQRVTWGDHQLFSALTDPYNPLEEFSEHKLYYFESSRGCPYNCAYCLSSAQSGVRFLDVDTAKRRLAVLSQKVRMIKFVDRTFNADPARARDLWQFMISLPGECRFHFEICAHLLAEADFALLSQPEATKIQFEIGLQSASPQALKSINRDMNVDQIVKNVSRLRQMDTVEVHLDLIAGLPGEGFSDFLGSVDLALSSRPHRLHLGFLKLLPGTQLRDRAGEYGLSFLPFAPYEVLVTSDMSAAQLLSLKSLEQSIDKFYNSRRFTHSLHILLNNVSPSQLFAGLSEGAGGDPYHTLFVAGQSAGQMAVSLREALLLDFLSHEPHRDPPLWLLPVSEEAERIRKIVYGSRERLYQLLPHQTGVKPGFILRSLRLGVFSSPFLQHLGFPKGCEALLIDHSKPPESRVFPVFPAI